MTPVRVLADHTWSGGRWWTADEILAGAPAPESADPPHLPRSGRRVAAEMSARRIAGTAVPGLRDHHVHLGLIDRVALATSVLSSVDDLGWIESEVLQWRRTGIGRCVVRAAGPFLTAPGGYPTGRSWAPAEAVLAIGSAEDAAATVRRLAAQGVDMVKVILHTGMPLLDEESLLAVVGSAHPLGLPVVVHAEGPGQAVRAAAAGADALAHAPWTETLDDEALRAMVGNIAWISTLAIHPRGDDAQRVALDNLARFAAAGGVVRYGTDMGNGPTPADLNGPELEALVEAGLELPAIMNAICRADRDHDHLTWTPYDPPGSAGDLPRWFATLRRRPVADLPGSR
ncbi:MAG TPA: hypothetical protein VIT42_15355 [Microlunatus sp.]